MRINHFVINYNQVCGLVDTTPVLKNGAYFQVNHLVLVIQKYFQDFFQILLSLGRRSPMTFVEKINKILEWENPELAEEYLHAARMKLDGWRNFVANHKKFPPDIRDDLLTKAVVKEYGELVKLTKQLEELLECY